ncbi:MAG: hypothetical protein OHK0013_09450 [Sandaracinaceae bacterium]
MSRLHLANARFVLVSIFLLLVCPAIASAQDVGAVRVRFETDGRWLHVSRVIGYQRGFVSGVTVRDNYLVPYANPVSMPVLAPVCDAPCDASLPTGFVRLALEDMRGSLLTDPFRPVAGATYRVWVDRHTTRGLGYMLAILGFVGMTAGGLTMGADLYFGFLEPDLQPVGWIATASSLLMALIGLPIASAGDGAHVEAIPRGVRF